MGVLTMEPIIKLRLLGSQLDDNELRRLNRKIFHTFGADKILSFLFNHFLCKYQQSGEHHNDLSTVNAFISNIIKSRQNSDDDDNVSMLSNHNESASNGESNELPKNINQQSNLEVFLR